MKRFNIRVYGLCINHRNEILLSDENYDGIYFTKFPGGGLEYGEGLKECLIREWKEELNIDIEVLSHYYTTDFFQASAFDSSQVISVYYYVKPSFISMEDFTNYIESNVFVDVKFHWKNFNTITPNDVSLPIDRVVVSMMNKGH